MKVLRWFLVIVLLTVIALPIQAQTDGRFRDAFVFRKLEGRGGIPLYWDGFIFQQYAGTTRDVIYANYTGSSKFILRLLGDGSNVFTVDKSGNVIMSGSLAPGSILLPDTDASNTLSLVWNENDSSNRTLNFLVTGANRSITLNENFTIGDGTDVTITAEDNAGTVTLDNATFEAENVNATQRAIKIATGTDADATITIEATSAVVNQDTTTDASPTFAGVTLTGNTIFTPSSAQVINAAGDAILANAIILVVNPDADYTLTSTPTIADGGLGQVIYITAANAEGFTVTLQDQDTLAGTNLQLLSSARTVTGKTTISLFFDGTDWIEFGSNEFSTLDIILPADGNIAIDGSTNPRTMLLGAMRFEHKPAIDDTRAIHIEADANSHADTHGMFISMLATGISAGESIQGIGIALNSGTSTGGAMDALRVSNGGTGGAISRAIHADPGVVVILQEAGTFAAIEQAWDENGGFTDVTTAFNATGTDVTIFSADNDKIYIGDAASFNALRVNLDTNASNPGIKPVFEFSIAGPLWTVFTPNDATNGFRISSTITWDESALTNWVSVTINAVAKKYIRITRTQANLNTSPIEDTIQISTSEVFTWDETGAVSIAAMSLSGLTATRLVSTDASKNLESSDATAWIAGTADDLTVTDDTDGTVTLSTVTLKDIVVAGTGMSGGADNVLPGADSDVTITLTVAKDIVVTGTGMSGGEDNVLPGGDADVTIALDVSKDIVAGVGLSGGEDNVLPGADADVTLTVDTTELTSLTWGASGGAFTHTFNAGATDPVWTYGTDGTANLSTGTLQEGGANVYKVGGTDVAVADGGTGVGSWTNGQLLVGNTAGNTAALATLTGTVNQVVVVNAASSITLSTPQDIHTGATPTFNGASFGDADLTNIGDIALDSVSSDVGAGLSNRITVANPMMNYIPGAYYREAEDKWQYEGTAAADQRYTLQSPARLLVDIDDTMYLISAQTDYDLSVEATWDTTAGTDYTVAANRAGVDFYIYAIQPGSGTTPLIEVSDNSSAPDGYTAANSRKIGGFHALCVAVGTIGGHPLTDHVAGDILPDSVWDYGHRPVSTPEGMVYSDGAGIWVDIYLASGTGGSTVSVYGGTISDTRDWMDFVDDGGAVKKRLLWDPEFQIIAAGGNEETNINGSADPGTTGGHSDSAGRRMISDIGVEDATGVMWQWLLDTSYTYGAGDHAHTTTITYKGSATGSAVSKDQAETNFNAVLGSGADETVNTSSVDPTPVFAYYDLPGAKGSLYRQGTYGDIKLLAGGGWGNGAIAGSRARDVDSWRWDARTSIGGRFASEGR